MNTATSTGIATTDSNLTAIYSIPTGYSADDVLATVLSMQHERAVILDAKVTAKAGTATVTIKAGSGIAVAEVEDMADRMLNPGPGVATDSVAITR